MVKQELVGEAGGGGREPPLAKLTGLQFGTLDEEDLKSISVINEICDRKSLWDNKLGVFNLDSSSSSNHCFTCGAQRPEECDGHFGIIPLPYKIYHPLHIDFVKHIFDGMCLVCHRIKPKEVVKKGNKEDETIWMDMKLNHGLEIVNEAQQQAPIEESDYKEGTLNESRAEESTKNSDHMEDIKNDLHSQAQESSKASNDVGCKYCGVNVKKEDRYPPLKLVLVKLSRKVGAKMSKTKHVTIKMVACAPEDKIPGDYWNFVNGIDGDRFDIRPLFPFEALRILKSLSDEAKSQLGMPSRIARPESLIMSKLPLPPSGSRIIEVYGESSIKQVRTDDQYRFLLCLLNEIKRIRSESPENTTSKFEQIFHDVEQLQIIAADYLAGSKWEEGVKLKRHNPVKEETEKTDKFMKGHILAKVNNACARMVVVGDPYIQLEEIALPLSLVNTVTFPEKVTHFNIKWLQEVVDNGPHAHLLRTGAVSVQRQGHGRNLLGFVRNKDTGEEQKLKVTLQIGDIVHRHLRNGDLVILNRTPSLSKHSLMGLRVRLQPGTVMSINPLICASFQADFDGDAMHVYVPQSAEARAEVHELLRLPEQLINSQRGQSNNGLTEDSRLGAYLLTSPHLFLDKIEMSHFLTSNSVGLPMPAIVKAKKLGPLWTGHQLYSTVIPKGVNYRVAPKWRRMVADTLPTSDFLQGVFIRDGELLVNDGQNSDWLGNTSRGLVASISKTHGSHVALVYLSRAQELANRYIQHRGFSVGIEDFLLTSNRSRLSRVKLEKIERTNKQALMRTLIGDEHVQRDELQKNPTSAKGLSIGMDCSRSKGLYLGTTELENRVEALDKLAIEWFQSKLVTISNRLAREFSHPHNSIFQMINANSKSMRSKVPQQVVSLGLQVYKGANVLPWSALDLASQNRLTGVSSEKMVDLVQSHPVTTPGYWESRGIITSSYLDGLSALQFFTHNVSSRFGVMRAKVEQPNMLRRRLLVFSRDLHVGYDGSVRSLEGQQIVQFEYGGLVEREDEKTIVPTRYEAGEAVGVSAATAITEPLYQLKLDSPHMIGAKAMGPLELVNETINAPKAMKLIDRQVLLKLRVPSKGKGTAMYAQERSALKIKRHLEPVTLSMLASSTVIEYRALRLLGEDGRETAPWIGHIQLNSEKLALHEVSVEDILEILRRKYSIFCVFSSSDRCLMQSPPASELGHKQCICFAMLDPKTIDDAQLEEFRFNVLEAMKSTVLPTLLRTIIKEDKRIESVHISWEEISWKPRSAKKASTASEHDIGELVVEVTVKKKYCKSDDPARAWNVVLEACHPVFHFIDWGRCIPYSIKAIRHVLGVEAANGVMLQRLELAFQGMGKDKEMNREHLKLIADSLTTSGEVNGASLAGYKEYCKTFSRSTPFHNAATQDHKKSFVAAGRAAAKETTDGALTSSVWGKAPGFGTGMFDVMWQPDKGVEATMQKEIDIHECVAKLPPPPLLAAEPNNGPPLSDRNGYRPRKSDWRNVVALGARTWNTSGVAKEANGTRTNEKFSQPKVPGSRGTPSEERSQEKLDTVKKGKRPDLASSDPFVYRNHSKNQLQKLDKAPLKEKQPHDSCRKEQEKDSRVAGSHALELQQTSRREKLLLLSGGEQTKKKVKELVELSSDSEDEDEDLEKLKLLVRDVKFILYQKYKPGQTLNSEDRKNIIENVLEHHPNCAEKVGCGLKDIKVDYHKIHTEYVCFFVIRQDETETDFSFRKCLQCYADGVSPTLGRLYASMVKASSR